MLGKTYGLIFGVGPGPQDCLPFYGGVRKCNVTHTMVADRIDAYLAETRK